MPHVDDGTLHALLDGALRADEPERADAVEAHLAGCPACRARRDAAAELLGRASGILAAIEPDIRPDFDEVLVRAGARETAHAEPEPRADGAVRGSSLRRQARWTRRLAWAATIVIALGTGYLIRDRVVPGRADQEAAVRTVDTDTRDRRARERESEADAGARPPSELVEERSAASTADGSIGDADADPARALPQAADAAMAAPVDAPEDEMRARARPQAGVADAALAAPKGQAVGGAEPVGRPAAPVAGGDGDGPLPSDLVVAETSRPAALTEQARAGALPGVAFRDTQSVRLEAMVVTGLARPATEIAVAPGGWVDVDGTRAAALLRGPLYRLQMGEAVRIETREVGDTVAVRTTQRLPSGLELRLVQRPVADSASRAEAADAVRAPVRGEALPSADAVAAAPVPLTRLARDRVMEFTASGLEVDLATVRLVRGDYELVLTGRLPPDLLRLLGASAEPVPR